MFDILFGWSKASKCKRAIKRTQYRLRLLKNKREAIARQLRKDLAELIQSGYEEAAFNRVEQLMEAESMAAAYESLDHFGEFILKQLSYIRRHKDCPNDINEAVSSLIFASARCGDLRELCVIRKLFGERYGEKFATTAVEVLPGNLVNKKLKENLSRKSVPDDLKYRVVDEIARDNCLQQPILAIEYYPKWQQVKENKGYQLEESGAKINDTILGSKVHPLEIEEISRDVKCVNSSISKPSDSCYLPKSSFADTYAIVYTVQQNPPYSPLQNIVEKAVEVDFPKLVSSMNSSLQNKEERLTLASSAERISFPVYPEEMLDYSDDIEECQFSLQKDGACQDKMLFKFKSPAMSRREKTQFGSDIDQEESRSETSSIRISRRSKRAHRKRSRRRSASLEQLGIMDIGYMIYYQKPCKSPSPHKHADATHYHRKHQKPSLEGVPSSNYFQKKLMPQSFSEKEKKLHSSHSIDSTRRKTSSIKIGGCSLDQPCYFCLYDDEACLETSPNKPEIGNRDTHVQQGVLIDEFCHCQPFWDDEMNNGMALVTIPQRPNRKSFSGEDECDVDCEAGNGNNEIKAKISASSIDSNPITTGFLTRIETEAPYTRAMTMLPERQRNCKDKMLRTFSCPPPHPNHVHPKLPDYEDLAAKFTALKREHLENRHQRGPTKKVEEAYTQH